MKFRFCGDGDCPDWVLTGIHSQLVTLSSIKLRVLSQHVAKSIVSESLPKEKIKDIFGEDKNIDITKAAFACLKFLIINSVKYNTDSSTFNEELQQLGLPKEHASAICKVVDEFSSRIKDHLESKILTVDEVQSIDVTKSPDSVFVQLNFQINKQVKNSISYNNVIDTVNIHNNDIPLLLKELKVAQSILEQYEKKDMST
uniref:CSON000587 protein n=1 Tax=Culicoides sonorensis TaxID=179676 RepID=A0A336KWJ0_CULSO